MKQTIIKNFAILLSKIVYKMAVGSANSASPFGVYQPKEPIEMKQLKHKK